MHPDSSSRSAVQYAEKCINFRVLHTSGGRKTQDMRRRRVEHEPAFRARRPRRLRDGSASSTPTMRPATAHLGDSPVSAASACRPSRRYAPTRSRSRRARSARARRSWRAPPRTPPARHRRSNRDRPAGTRRATSRERGRPDRQPVRERLRERSSRRAARRTPATRTPCRCGRSPSAPRRT